MNENALLRLENLKKSFDENPVLKGICLDVMPGEFVTLLGPSGCGKTTTLRIIAGLLEPDAGRVLLDGKDITRLEPEKRDVNTVISELRAVSAHERREEHLVWTAHQRREKVGMAEEGIRNAFARPAGRV